MTTPSFSREAIPALSVCDSPIEGKIVQELFNRWEFISYDTESSAFAQFKIGILFRVPDRYNEGFDTYRVYLQVVFPSLGNRRIDMVIWPAYAPMFLVEIDGFEHHSSKDRFISDRAKDRQALAQGFSTVRFAGSEVYAAPESVVDELASICGDLDLIEICNAPSQSKPN